MPKAKFRKPKRYEWHVTWDKYAKAYNLRVYYCPNTYHNIPIIVGYFRTKEDALETYNIICGKKKNITLFDIDYSYKTESLCNSREVTFEESIDTFERLIDNIPPRPYTPMLNLTKTNTRYLESLNEGYVAPDYSKYKS